MSTMPMDAVCHGCGHTLRLHIRESGGCNGWCCPCPRFERPADVSDLGRLLERSIARLEPVTINLEGMERATLIDALKAWGPSKMGNHTLYDVLLKKLEEANG